MHRVDNPASAVEWLDSVTPDDYGPTIGYDATGWPDNTWVLNSMYENASLTGLGTHDEIRRQGIQAGVITPTIIGGVNLDELTTTTGAGLGFAVRPGEPWVRITWREYLSRFPDSEQDRSVPPGFRWFPRGSWPVSIEPPTEGSLDDASLDALLGVLAEHERRRGGNEVQAFYAALPSGDFHGVHLWQGRVEEIPQLIDRNGGDYPSSPTNIWPTDRSWFTLTDWDLCGTKVSGPASLIDAIRGNDYLETVEWEARSDVAPGG